MEAIPQLQYNKKFYEGTNFWVALTLLVAGAWTGFNTETGNAITSFVIASFGAVFAVRQMIKTPRRSLQEWWRSNNTKNYLGAILVAVFGEGATQLIPLLNDLLEAIQVGNITGILTALLSFATILYYLIRNPQPPNSAPAPTPVPTT
ncbi:MAG: hypothetical protein AAF840_13930 [Bacteroidota bacterium]